MANLTERQFESSRGYSRHYGASLPARQGWCGQESRGLLLCAILQTQEGNSARCIDRTGESNAGDRYNELGAERLNLIERGIS